MGFLAPSNHFFLSAVSCGVTEATATVAKEILGKVFLAVHTTHIYFEGNEVSCTVMLPMILLLMLPVLLSRLPSPENGKEKEANSFHIVTRLASISHRETHDKSGSFEGC